MTGERMELLTEMENLGREPVGGGGEMVIDFEVSVEEAKLRKGVK